MASDDFLRKKFVTPTSRTTRPTTSRTFKAMHRSDIEFNKFLKKCDSIEHTF